MDKWTGKQVWKSECFPLWRSFFGVLRRDALLLCLFVAIAGFVIKSEAQAAEPPDLLRLRDVICAKESRTVSTPEAAVYKNPVTGKWDVGYCQISMDTLLELGYLARPGKPATRPTKWIFDRDGSKSIALEVINGGYMRILQAKRVPTYGCLTVKYKWGPGAACTKARLLNPDVQEIVAAMQPVAQK